MQRRPQPQESTPEPRKLLGKGNGITRPPKPAPPDKAEISRLTTEMYAELASNEPATVEKTRRLCEQLSAMAVERLGLHITGHLPATSAQVNAAAIAILKGAGVVANEVGDPEPTAPIKPRE